jgi:hypothetical protein
MSSLNPNNEGITVVVHAQSIEELIHKLRSTLAGYETSSATSEDSEPLPVDYPEEVRTALPNFQESPLMAMMYTVLLDRHRGEQNAVDSQTLATEIKERFPERFNGIDAAKISQKTVFPGYVLSTKRNLIHMESRVQGDLEFRVYWARGAEINHHT